STHSFGIHVARMAGMPSSLIRRANEILSQLETQHIQSTDEKTPRVGSLDEKVKEIGGPKMQLSIFDVHSQTFESIRTLLEGLDINRLTPVEALLKLQEIKNMIR
ncbi:DNA mismatch repair protein MutS, partial [Flavihumibacter sediminis]|nr:DNA mismatch repair protein MutS [Flavihumibacter sediminis]